MSDPVAEAAAQIAAQQAELSLLEKAMDTIHDLEAKVEHLIHPEAEAGSAAAGEPAIQAQAASYVTGLDTSAVATQPVSSESWNVAAASAESPNVVAAAVDGVPEGGAAPAAGGEAGNVVAGGAEPASSGSDASAPTASAAEVDLPNAVSGAAESTTATASAPSASGSGETSSIGGSSDEPMLLHARVANHLEMIYRMVKEAAPASAVTDTSALKTHVGDILHRISNGMQVTEGELVQKLEALYRML